MDINCASCGEPWDTYHIRHDAVNETPAGLDWLNWEISIDDWYQKPNNNTKQPLEPHFERWDGKLTPFWREQFKLEGWEFGSSLMAVLRCPLCKNAELSNAEDRRSCVQILSELYEGDDDAIISDNELALKFEGYTKMIENQKNTEATSNINLSADDLQKIVNKAWSEVRCLFSKPCVIFTFKHIKSKTDYSLLDIVLRESDLIPLAIYQRRRTRLDSSIEEFPKFSRPLTEFFKKFTPINI
jgi:hypothetical protein